MMNGHGAEELYIKRMSELGRVAVKSSKEEDMFKHIDVWVDGVPCDVKGPKRMDRHYDDGDDIIWVEKTNVRGDRGWLHGEAVNIVFVVKDEFWTVDRQQLVKRTDELITVEKVFDVKKHHKWYTRPGKGDVVGLLRPRDIEDLVIEKISL